MQRFSSVLLPQMVVGQMISGYVVDDSGDVLVPSLVQGEDLYVAVSPVETKRIERLGFDAKGLVADPSRGHIRESDSNKSALQHAQLELIIDLKKQIDSFDTVSFEIDPDFSAKLALLEKEEDRFEVAKVLAAKNAIMITENLALFRITDESRRIAIAEIAATQNGTVVSSGIELYHITDQQALIRIAKRAAAQSGRGLSANIGNYKIEDQDALLEILKIAMAQGDWCISQYVGNFGIKDQAVLIEIAKKEAAKYGGWISKYIGNYGITDQAALIEILKIAAAKSVLWISQYIDNYGITDQTVLIEIAKIAAVEDTIGVSTYIKKYGILSEEARIDILRIVEANSELLLIYTIKNFEIQNQEILFEFAVSAALKFPYLMPQCIQLFGLTDKAAVFKVLRIVLSQNPSCEIFNEILNVFDIGVTLPRSDSESLNQWFKDYLAMNHLPEEWSQILSSDTKRFGNNLQLAFALVELTGDQAGRDKLDHLYRASGPQGVARYLLSYLTGFSLPNEVSRSLSARTLSDLYEQMLGMQSTLVNPALEGLAFDESLFIEGSFKSIMAFMQSASRLKGLLGDSANKEWPKIAKSLKERNPLTREKIASLILQMDADLMTRFRALFKVEGRDVTFEQIQSLEDKWGDLSVLYTLVARFEGNSFWKKEQPLLSRIAHLVLNDAFKKAKYEGIEEDQEDVRKAKEQLKMLQGESARKGWQAEYQAIGIHEGEQSQERHKPDYLWKRSRDDIDQLHGHVLEYFQDKEYSAEESDRIKLILTEKPDDQTVQSFKKKPHELTLALFGLLKEADTVEYYKLILSLIQTNKNILSLSPNINSEVKQLKSRMDVKKSPAKSAIIFTTTVDDPKLLLMTGDLVDVFSCQNYKTGSHVETLLGYVLDAGVKLVLSYGLSEKDFEGLEEFKEAKRLVQGGGPVAFVAAKQVLKIGTIEVKLPKASVRRVIKLGATKEGKAGISLEREYQTTHMAEGLMAEQLAAVVRTLAKASDAALDQEITIPESRNPGGIYSDENKGVQVGAYKLAPAEIRFEKGTDISDESDSRLPDILTKIIDAKQSADPLPIGSISVDPAKEADEAYARGQIAPYVLAIEGVDTPAVLSALNQLTLGWKTFLGEQDKTPARSTVVDRLMAFFPEDLVALRGGAVQGLFEQATDEELAKLYAGVLLMKFLNLNGSQYDLLAPFKDLLGPPFQWNCRNICVLGAHLLYPISLNTLKYDVVGLGGHITLVVPIGASLVLLNNLIHLDVFSESVLTGETDLVLQMDYKGQLDPDQMPMPRSIPAAIWLETGTRLKRVERYEEAIASYKKRLELDPAKNKFNWGHLGECYSRLGKYDEAISYYEKAIEAGSVEEAVHTNLVKVIIVHHKDLARALSVLEGMPKLRPILDDEELRSTIKVILREIDAEQRAIFAEKLVEMGSVPTDVWKYFGDIFKKELFNEKEAVICYREALRHDPESVPAWVGLMQATDDPDVNIEAYEKAVSLGWSDQKFYSEIGWSYWRKGFYQKAVDILLPEAQTDSNFYLWYPLGNSYENLGKYKEALDAYQKADERMMLSEDQKKIVDDLRHRNNL